MSDPPRARLPALKKPALVLAGLFVFALVFLWQALPGIIQSQAEKYLAEKTGHRLVMQAPRVNPFELSLQLVGIELTTPDGQPLLACDNLLIDVAATSFAQHAWVFDAIRLDGLAVTLVEQAGGSLNWQPLLDALQDKPEKPSNALPRLDIRSFVLTAGRLDFADRRQSPGFSTRIEPLELNVTDLSTLPDDSGKFHITARTTQGAELSLVGEVDLDPLTIAGNIQLQGLQLAQLTPYLREALPAAPAGMAQLSARYRAGHDGKAVAITAEAIEARIAGLRLPLDGAGTSMLSVEDVALKGGSFDLAQQSLKIPAVNLSNIRFDLPGITPWIALDRISVEDARFLLTERTVSLRRFAINDGRLSVLHDATGRFPAIDALAALVVARQTAVPAVPSVAETRNGTEKPWRFRLDALDLANLAVSLQDQQVTPATGITLEKINLQVTGITDVLQTALPVKLSFQVDSGGSFVAEGQLTPVAPAADFKLKLADLALKPAQAYLADKTTLSLASGRLSAQGRFSLDSKGPTYRGGVALNELRLDEAGSSSPLLTWQSLDTTELTATPSGIDIGDLRLAGLDTRLVIEKDKSINLAKLVKPSVKTTEGAQPATTPFAVNIGRLRIDNGGLYFADHSLVMPFGTRIGKLRGSLGNLSSRANGIPGQLELEGEVDDYGMARAVGEVDLFDPTGFMDIRLLFRNVELNRLTPYMATFAGRKIDSGKLSLDLQYKLKQRQLQGDNQLVIDRLTLGERVSSPQAKDLPLDLAIAILQDSDGRIDLGLPVTGNLDDPEFSYGAIVWKAIGNVLTKVATAPFRALAGLFGGGEKMESIAFEVGAEKLTPPEREKLVRLASGLAKRPGLVLTLAGGYAESDRAVLQDMQLRRTLMSRIGQRVASDGDPGPLSLRQPAVREALEKLFGERFGEERLTSLKEAYRGANPGQLEESAGSRMLSRLSGLLREKKGPSESDMANLKGMDFHAVLYERLRGQENVGEERLQSLGRARGDYALAALQANGLRAERLHLLPPQKTDSADAQVVLRLELTSARDK